MNNTQTFWTYVLNGDALEIIPSFGFKNLSMELISGTASFIGTGQGDGTIPSESVPLYTNKPVTIATGSTRVIGGITIDASSGVVNIIAF